MNNIFALLYLEIYHFIVKLKHRFILGKGSEIKASNSTIVERSINFVTNDLDVCNYI